MTEIYKASNEYLREKAEVSIFTCFRLPTINSYSKTHNDIIFRSVFYFLKKKYHEIQRTQQCRYVIVAKVV